MDFWPTIIRLVLVANVIGTVGDIRRAVRGNQRNALHWLLPKAVGWAAILWAMLPARWGGVGMAHWQAIFLSGLGLITYGVMMKMTDVSSPPLLWFTFDAPHFGPIGPPHLVVLPVMVLAGAV